MANPVSVAIFDLGNKTEFWERAFFLCDPHFCEFRVLCERARMKSFTVLRGSEYHNALTIFVQFPDRFDRVGRAQGSARQYGSNRDRHGFGGRESRIAFKCIVVCHCSPRSEGRSIVVPAAGQRPDSLRTNAGQGPDREREVSIRATLRRSLRDGVFSIRIGVGQMKSIFDGLLMPDPDSIFSTEISRMNGPAPVVNLSGLTGSWINANP